uniref:Uncharacterized protein n=1 Tax=Kalanchoe fedtschenkoi TaxID=63787 RepID=A0A7N1A4G5_KALFE
MRESLAKVRNSFKPIKKWLEDKIQKRKEEGRLKRAAVHGAVSIAGVAAALAAIAAEKSETSKDYDKESAVASAAALVASQCAETALEMGATRDQLGRVIASARTAATAADILTLTAAAATSIRGADALKARRQCVNRNKGTSRPTVLSIKETEDDDDDDFDFEHGRFHISKGVQINIETSNGELLERWVSIDLNSKAEVIVRMRRSRTFSTTKECVVMDLHVELYSDPEDKHTTCYLIVLTTNRGMMKLDMSKDYASYKMWVSTIKRMLMISMSMAVHF